MTGDPAVGDIRIMVGDVFDRLRELPDQCVDCVVTSPPYWGLRDYDTKGQIGLEPTLGDHLDVMVDVFREVRRVLKLHGTLWLNYGDCYAAEPNGKSAAAYKADGSDDRTFRDKPFSTVGPIDRGKRTADRWGGGNNPSGAIYQPDDSERQASRRGRSGSLGNGGINGVAIPSGRVVAVVNPRGAFASGDRQSRNEGSVRIGAGGYLKPKDLCMLPNRLAIALQDDGWWVRSEIIWHKPNPMPESVYDRPTTAHEKVWLLTRNDQYFYNHEAIREPVTGGARRRAPGPNSRESVDRVPRSRKIKVPDGWDTEPGPHGTINRSGRTEATYREMPGVTPKSAPENSNIRAKASFHATTTDLVESKNARNVWTIAPAPFREAHFATFPPALAERCILAGTPKTVCGACGSAGSCGGLCSSFERQPGHVLDPFGGAGTVGLVAQRLGLRATLIELNPAYAEMARRRIERDAIPIAEAAE